MFTFGAVTPAAAASLAATWTCSSCSKNRFADSNERDRAYALRGHCGQLTPMLLEIVLVAERILHQPEALGAALNLKLATRLIHGEDIRPDLPSFDAATYVRSIVHQPYFSYI